MSIEPSAVSGATNTEHPLILPSASELQSMVCRGGRQAMWLLHEIEERKVAMDDQEPDCKNSRILHSTIGDGDRPAGGELQRHLAAGER